MRWEHKSHHIDKPSQRGNGKQQNLEGYHYWCVSWDQGALVPAQLFKINWSMEEKRWSGDSHISVLQGKKENELRPCTKLSDFTNFSNNVMITLWQPATFSAWLCQALPLAWILRRRISNSNFQTGKLYLQLYSQGACYEQFLLQPCQEEKYSLVDPQGNRSDLGSKLSGVP